MTERAIGKNGAVHKHGLTAAKRFRGTVISLAAIFASLAAALFLSDDIGVFASEGLRLATERVLPTALPFMIISGFLASMIREDSIPLISGALAGIFAVSREGIPALLIGNVAGFPIGGKMTSELYAAGRIGRGDAERLLAYSSNPSPAFIIGGVGAGLLGDGALGAILLVSLILGTVISAQLFRDKTIKISNHGVIYRQKYDFVASVKSAAEASVSIIAFVTLFYTAAKAIELLLGKSHISTAVILVLEVTGALTHISMMTDLSLLLRIGLSAFALGFGGISVMLQTAVFSRSAGLKMTRYFQIKISEGIFSALAAILLTYLYMHAV